MAHIYIARVVTDPEIGGGQVVLNVFRDTDVAQIGEGDAFVTITTKVPLFGEPDE